MLVDGLPVGILLAGLWPVRMVARWLFDGSVSLAFAGSCAFAGGRLF